MKRFGYSAVGVAQGNLLLFSAFEDDGPMWSGHGPRMVRRKVTFERPFRALPIVHISMSMWDIESGANQRADISTENINLDGFDIIFRTWGDTRVARIRADWLAIGEVRHEDDFDL